MGKSTRGYCKYCSKEYTRTGMVKHLQTCKRRVDLYEKATETEKYFELLLYGAYNKDYWLIIQIKENATLDDLDQFMLWEAYELDLEKLLDYPVWYADYEELPQTPYRFSMWQYSSTGSVPGIEGNVDLNIQLLKK